MYSLTGIFPGRSPLGISDSHYPPSIPDLSYKQGESGQKPEGAGAGMKRKSAFPMIILILILVFFYLPLFVLVINSFNASRVSSVWGGFSLKWYKKLLGDQNLLRSVKNTVIVTSVSVFCSTVLGSLAGVSIARFRSRVQKVHSVFIALPLIMPDILIGISLLLFFISFRIQLSLLTIIIGHITFCISYVASTVQARFRILIFP